MTLLNFYDTPPAPVGRFRTFELYVHLYVIRIDENTARFPVDTNVLRTREIMFRFGSGSILRSVIVNPRHRTGPAAGKPVVS